MQKLFRGEYLHHKYGTLLRYKVSANKDDLSPDRLDEANVMVFGLARDKCAPMENVVAELVVVVVVVVMEVVYSCGCW